MFTVPILGSQALLCYEVWGEPGRVFNLVSDKCLSVSAAYEPMDIPENGNIIRAIGVNAIDTNSMCHNIEVRLTSGSDRLTALVDNAQVVESGGVNGITVRRRSHSIHITVPNCESQDIRMWVTHQENGGQSMLEFTVAGGNTLAPTSHGLIGELTLVFVHKSCIRCKYMYIKSCISS